jgi:hypothetical protein
MRINIYKKTYVDICIYSTGYISDSHEFVWMLAFHICWHVAWKHGLKGRMSMAFPNFSLTTIWERSARFYMVLLHDQGLRLGFFLLIGPQATQVYFRKRNFHAARRASAEAAAPIVFTGKHHG